MRGLLATGLVLAACAAHADPIKLRFAAVAPEGTAWARELHALARDVETQTDGQVQMKWYLGAVAGSELAALDRVKRGQLDGIGGALFCTRLAPSMWVLRLAGLFTSHRQAQLVLNRLRPALDKEFEKSGFVDLGLATFGVEILFSRKPIRSMADLRASKVWIWDLDEALKRQVPAMGMNAVPVPLEEAGKAFEQGRVDGFIGLPTAALAFQWAALARYYTELPVAMMPGCLVVARHTFEQLTIDQQQALRAAAAKFFVRFADLGEHQDQALLSGLFEHQGLQRVALSQSFRSEFNEAAHHAHAEAGVPLPLLQQVLGWLTESAAR
jgi:TRAP-type C4-dicarboxylate transport system substrate-binding protein